MHWTADIGRALLRFAFIFALAPAMAAPPVLQRPNDRGVPTLAPLMARVTPAVVNISVQSAAPVEDNPLFRDPFFRRFFDLPGRRQPQQSVGSGVIVDAAQGYVLTNFHVIESATEITVTLKDRRSFQAKLIGGDRGTDIALLRIEARGLTALAFGDSDMLRVGDFVVAIGNPFGLGQTVTSGIVSALGRSGINIEGYEDFIQTDASINPGNSGGALVNLSGELVGINTAILGPGGNIGIGFAVPSNMARAVMDQLARYGEVRRGRLGIAIQDLTPELARRLGVAQLQGAVVTQVEGGSSAAQAGMQVNDVVIEVDGHRVRDAADLRNRIGLIRIGQQVELVLLRGGRRMTVQARVGATRAAMRPVRASEELAGMTVEEIAPGTPLYGKVQGVIVTEIVENSPAWRHGIRQGDVITQVNGREVRGVNALKEALRTPSDVIALNILRGDGELMILIR